MKTQPPIFTARWIDGEWIQEAPPQGGPHQRAPWRRPVAPMVQKQARTAAVVDRIKREALDKAGGQMRLNLGDKPTRAAEK